MAEYKKFNECKKCFFLFCLLLIFSGCATSKKVHSEFPEKQIGSSKIVFLGLISAMPDGNGPDLFSNPLLNTMISAEPVSQDISDRLSDILYTLIEGSRNYNIINMKGYQTSGFNSADPLDINAIKALVKEISADFVITGYVYRIREREGSDYSANSPASVSFDIYIINLETGLIPWKGSYYKTQKFLSDNLLDFKSFLKFKGKWADVESLASAGLKELVDDMPVIKK
ncbi:MAG: hypothetical protein JW927_12720 [Deltaproteobacteria bacterium]|nr:hypothetical protein [Deltaproteobacteria bacterium]